jgi:cation:H+ antiporter
VFPWITFVLSAGVVVAAGIRLDRDGDVIAAGTGLGGMWIGAILLAAATSLPELATDSHAILQGHAPLAVGDLFGSSMANMAILALADQAVRKTRLLARVGINQALVGALGICLTAIAAAGMLTQSGFALLGLGWPVAAVGFGYVAGMRLHHLTREEPPFRTPEEVAAHRPSRPAVRRAMVGVAAAGLVIFFAGRYLAASTAEIALRIGISQGFGGMLLLAITTSLPEATVTVASVRAGSYNLAVGNLLGSNCFNMAALVPLDLLEGPGSLLAQAGPATLMGALTAILMTAMAVFNLVNRTERKIWLLEPGPMLLLLTYVVGLVLSFRA